MDVEIIMKKFLITLELHQAGNKTTVSLFCECEKITEENLSEIIDAAAEELGLDENNRQGAVLLLAEIDK